MQRLWRMYVCSVVLLVVLCGCQQPVSRPNYALIESAAQLPPGRPLNLSNGGRDVELRSGKVGEIVYVDMQHLDPPAGYYPLGMLDSHMGYLVEKDIMDALLLYDYQDGSFQAVIDYRSSDMELGLDIAFSDRWLIWLEMDPFLIQEDGLLRRQVRLMVRDVQSGHAEMVLDSGSVTPAEGFYMPFDYLCLDGDTLVYRYSIFSNGRRDTRVKLGDLSYSTVRTLASASGVAGRQITHCSFAGKLVAWSVQTNVQVQISGLAPLQREKYSIYCYTLDDGTGTSGGQSEWTLTQNDDYYAPVVHNKDVYALLKYPVHREWELISDPPIIYLDNDQRFANAIVRISTSFRSAQVLVRGTPNAVDLLQEYKRLSVPVAVQRHNIYVGKRLLSWKSNIPEQNIVLDIANYCLLELPIRTSSSSDDAPKEYWVRPIPGLDADYLVIEFLYDDEPSYILRIE